MTTELKELIINAYKKYEMEKRLKHIKKEHKKIMEDFVACDIKLAKMLDDEQQKALKDFHRAIFTYDEMVRVEYFVAGYLSSLKINSY